MRKYDYVVEPDKYNTLNQIQTHHNNHSTTKILLVVVLGTIAIVSLTSFIDYYAYHGSKISKFCEANNLTYDYLATERCYNTTQIVSVGNNNGTYAITKILFQINNDGSWIKV